MESLVSDIPPGVVKIAKKFLQCGVEPNHTTTKDVAFFFHSCSATKLTVPLVLSSFFIGADCRFWAFVNMSTISIGVSTA